ncbi:MAG TPA: ABC transporter permease [Steroidobacteraceae bacterium]|jgi:putative ABC transport system permease protein|nr:ABC transporter permease [Steroidobacteraceae bacterium]
MSYLTQLFVVLRLHVRTFPRRIKSALVIALSLVPVVGFLLAILSLGEGMRLACLGAGDAHIAIVLSAGAITGAEVVVRGVDGTSSLAPALISHIEGASGIRRLPDGSPLADAQVALFQGGLTKVNGGTGFTNLRGIGVHGLALMPHFRLLSGRSIRPNSNDLMVGGTAQGKFSGLKLGDRITLEGNTWSVVGVFSTSSFDDGDLLVSSQRLLDLLPLPRYSSVLVGLQAPGGFNTFRRDVLQTQALPVSVERLSDYWAHLYATIPSTAFIIAYVISALVAAGALAGIIHLMHAAVDARAAEIAVLRAIGFSGVPVAASVVIEALVLACLGAAIATLIDRLWLEGYAYNGAFGVFRAAVTFRLFFVGAAWAVVVAFIGALLPSIRAATTPVMEALGA